MKRLLKFCDDRQWPWLIILAALVVFIVVVQGLDMSKGWM